MIDRFKSFGKTFLYAVLAGVCIGIGGTGYLMADNKIMGSVLFTVGLFAILTFGYNLYTGRVCYVFEKNRRYALGLPLMWLGNLLGAWLVAEAMSLTRLGPGLAEKALALSSTKLSDDVLSIFILAFFCNVLIYFAVEGYNKSEYELGKYLSVFFGVVVFIQIGFEHCVANMFYFSMAEVWDGKAWLYILVMTLGNTVGGIGSKFMGRWRTKKTQAKAVEKP